MTRFTAAIQKLLILLTREVNFVSERTTLEIKIHFFKVELFSGGKYIYSMTPSLCERGTFVTSYLLNYSMYGVS